MPNWLGFLYLGLGIFAGLIWTGILYLIETVLVYNGMFLPFSPWFGMIAAIPALCAFAFVKILS